jgi:5,10-methylene-tetrahydrofolate dehydrogenase/methenyl tetrahydrofolate cyclohydrolase
MMPSGVQGTKVCSSIYNFPILIHADIDLEGKNAVVIGRSHIVGQPVSKLLLQKNASVTIFLHLAYYQHR